MSFDDYVTKSKKSETEKAESAKRNESGFSNQKDVDNHISASIESGVDVSRDGRPDMSDTDYTSDSPEEKGSIPVRIKLSDGTKCTANLFFTMKNGKPVVDEVDSDSVKASSALHGLMKAGGYLNDDPHERRDNNTVNSALQSNASKLITPDIVSAINKERAIEKKTQIRDSK